MKIKPIFDRVVLEPVKVKEKVVGGIILPNNSEIEPMIATVVAVGNGELGDGKKVDMQVKVGDKVLYAKFAGSDYTIDGKDYVVVRQTDILAIID